MSIEQMRYSYIDALQNADRIVSGDMEGLGMPFEMGDYGILLEEVKRRGKMVMVEDIGINVRYIPNHKFVLRSGVVSELDAAMFEKGLVRFSLFTRDNQTGKQHPYLNAKHFVRFVLEDLWPKSERVQVSWNEGSINYDQFFRSMMKVRDIDRAVLNTWTGKILNELKYVEDPQMRRENVKDGFIFEFVREV